ncbi:DUF6249 domain-containing protein [Aquimarina sp. 2201CG5-10]|uniref:DUF6249 domain-containing protein n=1 Tax=Aquimarina callyspongiae TaxID=3098150 RepID=UPI002AB48E91|nr:DUF6249 domain-containing protein [Aquimarina sp. 2201CG5-10]MDY8137057.1 DUF6249 domain-containing protein [Aquimarina sp. 2201CG5-10]
MKPIFITSLSRIDPDIYKVIVVIFVILLVMRFIIVILHKMLDHKLKNKIIDKGVDQDLASSILQTESNNETHNSIKWFIILMTTGGGLFLTNQYLPLGLHSIGIMTISIAIGFLAYYAYLKRFNK